MRTFKMTGPDGRPMVTSATSEPKARANFRWRLVNQYGMSWYTAGQYDMSDLREE